MFETSIEMADGSVAEFMETFFPRDLVIAANAKPLLADAALEPLADRYRFLDSGDIFMDIPGKGRLKTKVASRFASTPGTTIDWYVTPNIPDDYIPQIKTAIEGWNRYSQKMWSADIIAFKGRLPAGVKIGDPRFNVVNWDSIADAGAAYESQATDPYTGLTTHSLIYLPKAWINIGKQYWESGGPSEALVANTEKVRNALKRSSFLGQHLQVRCVEDPFEKISLDSRIDVDGFSKELLKGVLFHEVGHAMGLAHNFKGSLSFDPNDAKTSMSTSIMDYNQYQLEKATFDKLDSASGPLLEYDRQIISVLYNSGKDVTATDPTVPTCADSEADDEDDGMDPLCIRYDAGHDPTLQLLRTIDLIRAEQTTNRDTHSLPTAIKTLVNGFTDSSSLKDRDGTEKAVKELTKSLKGIVAFYYTGGAQSLSYMARANLRSMRLWKEAVLPEDAKEYVEQDMRRRAFEGIRYATTTESFEPETKAAIETFKLGVKNWLASTNYILNLSPEKQTIEMDALLKGINAAPAALEKSVLTKLRTRIFGDMKASEKSPYFFLESSSNSVDFEREVAQILSRAVIEALSGGKARSVDERVAAARSLKSFEHSAVGSSFIADASQAVQAEAKTAHDMAARTNAVAVLKALTQEDK